MPLWPGGRSGGGAFAGGADTGRRKNGRWKFSTYYGIGAAMGFTPVQVGGMTPWQFMASLEGFGRANGWQPPSNEQSMSIDRMRELGIEGV